MGTKAREGKDRTRIGSRHAKMQNGLQVVVRDSFPVTERIGESVTQRPLDRVESAQILMDTWDGKKDKEKIALFLENGRVYKLVESDILNKSWKELTTCTIS